MVSSLRLPVALHARVAIEAQHSGLSINALCCKALDDYLTWQERRRRRSRRSGQTDPRQDVDAELAKVLDVIDGGGDDGPFGPRSPRMRLAAQAAALPVVGVNAPCPCGSGRKYKKCHGVRA